MKSTLTFFITQNKTTEELTLQYGTLVSFKIPKVWQKPDSNTNNPALWVCHLPDNPLEIAYVSLYPTELVIGKKMENASEEQKNMYGYTENSQLICLYKGDLEPNGENEKEKFFRCQLRLQKKEQQVQSSGAAVFLIILVVAAVIGGIVWVASNNKTQSRPPSYSRNNN